MANDYDDSFTDWRFDAPKREHLLERRVKELEETVSRLEKALRFSKIEAGWSYNEPEPANRLRGTAMKTIGAMSGTIGDKSVLPASPYKAD